MVRPSDKELELNEVGWMASSCDVAWFGDDLYLISSDLFREYWFNRAGVLECPASLPLLDEVEARFAGLRLPPHFFIQETCTGAISTLKAHGYEIIDGASVLTLENPTFNPNPHVRIRESGAALLDDWVRVYLLAFYGNLDLAEEAKAGIRLALRNKEAQLLSAEIEGEPAGELALFRSPSVLGIYALGTLPSFRRSGVAGSLIQEAHRIATSEGRVVALQTILSDSVEAYYVKGGFRRRYLKHLLRKRMSPS